MPASLLNDTLRDFDPSEAFMRLKEACHEPDWSVEREAFTPDRIHSVLTGLAVALYTVEVRIPVSYAREVWWLLQHCQVAVDILDAIDRYAEVQYVPVRIRQTLREDWLALQQKVEERSRLTGIHTLAEQLRRRKPAKIRC